MLQEFVQSGKAASSADSLFVYNILNGSGYLDWLRKLSPNIDLDFKDVMRYSFNQTFGFNIPLRNNNLVAPNGYLIAVTNGAFLSSCSLIEPLNNSVGLSYRITSFTPVGGTTSDIIVVGSTPTPPATSPCLGNGTSTSVCLKYMIDDFTSDWVGTLVMNTPNAPGVVALMILLCACFSSSPNTGGLPFQPPPGPFTPPKNVL